MISLRQHIFSLVAVFVALAVGIAAGSTVVRGPLLDSTRARLEAAEDNIEIERAENDALAGELAQLDDWVVDGPSQLLSGRLADLGVLLIVAGEVDEDVVDGIIRSVRATSGTLLGELRIDPVAMNPEQAERVAQVMEVSVAANADGIAPMELFGERIAEIVPGVVDSISGATAVNVGAELRAAFGDLEDAGLVDLLQVTTGEVTVTDVSVLLLTDRNLVNDPTLLLDGVVTMSDPAGAGVPLLVAEVGRVAQDNGTPAASFVRTIRDDGRLRDEVSTVDNAETILGWVAAVLALEAGHNGSVGHYGFREGADGAIPARGV